MGRVDRALQFFGLRQPHPANTEIPWGSIRIGQRHAILEGVVMALPIVRRCIGEWANLVNDATPMIMSRDRKASTELPSWLERPNPFFTLPEMNEQGVWSLAFDGEVFLVWNLDSRGMPVDLWIPRAQDISYNSTGKSIIYQAWWGEGEAQYISHRRLLSAPAVWRGVGVTRTGVQLTDSAQDAQSALNRKLVQDAVMGVFWSFTEKLTPDQRKAFITQLERNYQGPENAGAPIVAEKGVKAERIAPSTADMMLQELNRDLNARIASEVFFLDPMTFGYSIADSGGGLTYKNASELRSRNYDAAAKNPASKLASLYSDTMLGIGGKFMFSPIELHRGSPANRSRMAREMALANADHVKNGLPPIYDVEEIRAVTQLLGPGPQMFDIDAELAALTESERAQTNGHDPARKLNAGV